MTDATRNAAHEAEAALRRAGDLHNALAVKKLLASHAAMQAQLRIHYDEVLTLRRITRQRPQIGRRRA